MPFLNSQHWHEIHRPKGAARTPAIFLDRDGVIIEEKHYLRDPDQVELIPGTVAKLKELLRHGLPLVVVTNQSGIGQGLFSWAAYELVHQRMLDLIGIDKPFAAIYANSHAPTETQGTWRKPNPGMFVQAAADLNLCLESSAMVGDKVVDLEAASRAGIKRIVHVKTGHGTSERAKVIACYPRAELVNSLADFALDACSSPLDATQADYKKPLEIKAS
jgi:D-glycero-D-manno-heptose 1,7-bisphosphate phosphatase